ncbi:siderophore-interacting protein [Leifsonia sp. YIM 134122]|uniref:Siderophore-interacting protein n=1 Tax=Leifsonia stereocauli TaxID=3134136 RepID=A0ABU9W387_9MICO
MLTSQSQAEAVVEPRPAYRVFAVTVSGIRRLSQHFVRLTFSGDDLADFGTAGLDQRVKIVLPLAESGFAHFPRESDWYGAWRDLPEENRNPFRTYTVRAVRPELREVDVDFAMHGETGPASAWAASVQLGDDSLIVGPDERSPGRALGIDWRPGDVRRVLLAGDETAAPAICAILESLPADAQGCAIIEIPTPGDVLPVVAPAGVSVRWHPRGGGIPQGGALIPAVRDWTVRTVQGHPDDAPAPLDDIDIDREMLWDVPEGHSLDGEFYAWIAGEASVIKTVRRFLVSEAGLDRRSVAFMGYWRLGRAELD